MRSIGFTLGLIVLLAGCGSSETPANNDRPSPESTTGAITLTSAAFQAGEPIPQKHTGDGDNHSPPLSWTGVPDEAKSIAIICEDPDAPTPDAWVHWVIFNLPGDTTKLAEGIAASQTLEDLGGALQGTNDFLKTGYGGPDPLEGDPHRYFFKIYALDTMLDLKSENVTKFDVLREMKGHILEQGELMGTYQKKPAD